MTLLALPLLAGCAELGLRAAPAPRPSAPAAPASIAPETARVVVAPRPPAAARTAAQYDTTTPEQRAAAAAPPAAAERALGSTVASLGNPAEAGLWIETPLAEAGGEGRIATPATGKSALVELRPIPGAATAGSRVSLAAMRLVGAPLAGLPTLEVYAR